MGRFSALPARDLNMKNARILAWLILGCAIGCATLDGGPLGEGDGDGSGGGSNTTSGSGGTGRGTGGTSNSGSGGASTGMGGVTDMGGAMSGDGDASGGATSPSGGATGTGGSAFDGQCAGVGSTTEVTAEGDVAVFTCTKSQAACVDSQVREPALFECVSNHVPNCLSQKPEDSNNWSFIGLCSDLGLGGSGN